MKNRIKNFLKDNQDVLMTYSIGVTAASVMCVVMYNYGARSTINGEIVKQIRTNGLSVHMEIPDDIAHVIREFNALKNGIPQ